MFSIGDFSRMTGLSVKTLRFYHEQGVLTPCHVDGGSGYRYYTRDKVEVARVIQSLREFEFSLQEIRDILGECDDDAGLIAHFERRKSEIQVRMKRDREKLRSLNLILEREQEAVDMAAEYDSKVERKIVQPVLVASVRMQGKYSDCGQGFKQIGRAFGWKINGKPLMLCHDREYRDDDANFEVAMPIRKGRATDEIDVKELPGGTCISLMHRGPYEQLPRTYETLLSYLQENKIDFVSPTREVYHKGPGMIFRGNPQKYLTEIQMFLKDASS